MATYTFTTPAPLTVSRAEVPGMRLTPGSPWTVSVRYQRGFEVSGRFVTLDQGAESIEVAAGSQLTRLEAIRDDILTAIGAPGVTATAITLTPPTTGSGGAWDIAISYTNGGSISVSGRLSVSDTASVTRLEALLTDAISVMQSRGIVDAGSLVF